MFPTFSEQPLCRHCGKPIAKHTESVYVRDPQGGSPFSRAIEGPLYSKAECQERTNKQVISLRYYQKYDYETDSRVGPRYVTSFNTWDGESYVDGSFCSGTCATKFAYLMARHGHCTKAYNEAMAARAAKAKGEAA